jgi:hypothetical protein
MCFSAAASFTSAAVIGGLGAGALIRAPKSTQRAFAAIPLIFALQQCIEGGIWLAIRSSSPLAIPLTYVFLFFALVWWPLYIPFVAYRLEEKPTRRTILVMFGIIGMLVGIGLYIIFLHSPTTAQIANKCIYYPLNVPYRIVFGILYAVATIGPGFVSTNRSMRLFCALLGIFGLFTFISYNTNLVSVWCFFAAVISLVIFFSDSDFRRIKEKVKKLV